MTNSSAVRDIKKAQRESILLKKIAELFMQVAMDDIRLHDIYVNRTELSPSRGMCTVYFYSPLGKKHFDELLEVLKLYKPSLRKAVSQTLDSRYTPDLMFRFDEQHEKALKIEALLEKVKSEDQLLPEQSSEDQS